MHRKRGWLISVLVVTVMLCTGLGAAYKDEPASSFFRLAELEDLTGYPETLPESVAPGSQLFAVRLPESDLAVILRPITEPEYGAFQIQAIGHEIIERQVLAAAIVLPHVDEEGVVGIPLELVEFLKQQVNAISGFEVFDVINLSTSP